VILVVKSFFLFCFVLFCFFSAERVFWVCKNPGAGEGEDSGR
jgi:hypothetical protein